METIEIELSRIFVKVVQQGGFSKAADLLKIPKSSVSKAVSRLEAITGTKLLLRTTRSHTLTAAGRLFYETCLGPIQVLEDAQKSLYGMDSIASGNIKITAPEDLGTYMIAPAIGRISRENPHLSFDLQYTNELIDLVKDGFDLAVRIGKLKESGLMARRIGRLDLILVASSQFLEENKNLKSPQDLVGLPCLSISGLLMTKNWELQNIKTKKKSIIKIRPVIESNQMSSLLQAAKAGAGILLAPSFICKPAIEAGHLIHILPEWSNVGLPVSLISPLSIASTARIKIVADELYATIKPVLK